MRYTANYSLKEPQKNVDLADVEDLNDNFEDIDEIMHSTQISLAPAYDQTLTYAVGDLVMYENLLYKCIIAITVAEAWDATKWERAVLSDSAGGGGGNANVTELTYNQYLALSQAEKTNGTIYMVTDDPSDSSSGGGGGGISYSTTEQNTGLKWVDGKDIYQRTFIPNITLTQSWEPIIDMTGIDWITDIEYNITRDGEQAKPEFNDYDHISWLVRNGYIQFSNNTTSSASVLVLKDVTIRYTKATSVS